MIQFFLKKKKSLIKEQHPILDIIMPNNKKKSLKSIKNQESLHPYSRKASQMKRALHRQDRLSGRTSAKTVDRTLQLERLLYFKKALAHSDSVLSSPKTKGREDALLSEKGLGSETPKTRNQSDPPIRKSDVHELIQTYLSRHDSEIESLKLQTRKGRPTPPRLALLESLRDKELKEYEQIGFGKLKAFFIFSNSIQKKKKKKLTIILDIPVLMCPKNLKAFQDWNGDWNALDKIQRTRVTRHELLPPSTSMALDSPLN